MTALAYQYDQTAGAEFRGWAGVADTTNSNGVHRLTFDKTVSLGHVLTIVTMMAGMVTAYVTYRETIIEHRSRIQQLEAQVKHMVDVNQDLSNSMWNIKQDVAIIRDRIERQALK